MGSRLVNALQAAIEYRLLNILDENLIILEHGDIKCSRKQPGFSWCFTQHVPSIRTTQTIKIVFINSSPYLRCFFKITQLCTGQCHNVIDGCLVRAFRLSLYDVASKFATNFVKRKLYMYTAIAPIPLSSFAGEPTQSVGVSFLKSYAAVCLEGAIIVLACIIFSVFAATPPSYDASAAAITMVWGYVGELIFGMLVLTGTVKMADRVVHEMIGV